MWNFEWQLSIIQIEKQNNSNKITNEENESLSTQCSMVDQCGGV